MAAFDFPSSPSNGDNYTANGVTWSWDGSAWRRSGGTVSYTHLTLPTTLPV